MKANEPAFPTEAVPSAHGLLFDGFTKRELGAFILAQGLLATGNFQDGETDKKILVMRAIMHADSLLAELNKENK